MYNKLLQISMINHEKFTNVIGGHLWTRQGGSVCSDSLTKDSKFHRNFGPHPLG